MYREDLIEIIVEAISKKQAVELAHGVRIVSRGPGANRNLSQMNDLLRKAHAANAKKKKKS
jgi:hypothetical protein